MNINDYKIAFDDDAYLNKIIKEALDSGIIDENANLTEKGNKYGKNLDSYVNAITNKQFLMIKVEGISLENLHLEDFTNIHKSVDGLVGIAWARQRDSGFNISKKDYVNNVELELLSASFQVNISLPSFAKESTEMSLNEMISSLTEDNEATLEIDSALKEFLVPMQKILASDEVTGIRLTTDENIKPNEAPEIKKSRNSYIQKNLESYDRKMALIKKEDIEVFNKDVLVYASDSKTRTFKAYSEEKSINFDCSEPKSKDSWYHVITNQIESFDEIHKAVKVNVIGKLSAKTVIVESIKVSK